MKDGGPAFPVPAELCQDLTVQEQRGMTLRDWFAGMAMQALLHAWTDKQKDDSEWPGDAHLARESYVLADAMIQERSKE